MIKATKESSSLLLFLPTCWGSFKGVPGHASYSRGIILPSFTHSHTAHTHTNRQTHSHSLSDCVEEGLSPSICQRGVMKQSHPLHTHAHTPYSQAHNQRHPHIHCRFEPIKYQPHIFHTSQWPSYCTTIVIPPTHRLANACVLFPSHAFNSTSHSIGSSQWLLSAYTRASLPINVYSCCDKAKRDCDFLWTAWTADHRILSFTSAIWLQWI